MKKGLLLSVAFLFYGEANAACMPELDCASLGYKYSYSQCGGKGLACLYDSGKYFCPETVSSCSYTYTAEDCAAECKNIGSLTCSKNGKTYYASCGSSKCLSGQTCNYGTCVTPTPSCTYRYTVDDCARQCKNVEYNSCVRNGITYYQSCGSSKCASGQTCENGTCNFQCIYQYTASDCANLCKNIGSKSCVRNGTTYYEGCGASKCSSGQTCTDGYCKQSVEKQGYCCDDGEIYCGSGYTNCHTATSYPDCSDVRTSCRTAGGTPSFLSCGTLTPTGAPYAYFNCK